MLAHQLLEAYGIILLQFEFVFYVPLIIFGFQHLYLHCSIVDTKGKVTIPIIQRAIFWLFMWAFCGLILWSSQHLYFNFVLRRSTPLSLCPTQ